MGGISIGFIIDKERVSGGITVIVAGSKRCTDFLLYIGGSFEVSFRDLMGIVRWERGRVCWRWMITNLTVKRPLVIDFIGMDA